MVKEHLLAGNGVLLACSFIGFIYGAGALLMRGDWHLFLMTALVFGFFIASEVVLALIQ